MVRDSKKIYTSIVEDGVSTTFLKGVRHIHKNYIRQFLPRRTIQMNGVKARSSRLFDEIVPWKAMLFDPDHFESAIVDSLKKWVKPGDDVVVIGGGWGVTTVIAAEQNGPDGSVISYEASPNQAESISETVELNNVADRVTVENSVVSEAISVIGEEVSQNTLPPSELPKCDVLELDCEGAELGILDGISFRPRVIIVESHGHLDSPTDQIVEKLESMSYEIQSREPAEQGRDRKYAVENDVYVVTGILLERSHSTP